MTITQSLDISRDTLESLLVSALEGGSNYWYMITDMRRASDWPKGTRYPHEYALSADGALMIDDSTADEPTLKRPVRLDIKRIKRGIRLMASSREYAHHWRDVMADDADAITGDVFLQFCIFGRVIYG